MCGNDALNDFGFKISLSRKDRDISAHSRVLKVNFSRNLMKNLGSLYESIKERTQNIINTQGNEVELFKFTKEIMFKSVISILLGHDFEINYPNFVEDYQNFQLQFSKALMRTVLFPRIISKRDQEDAICKRENIVSNLVPIIKDKIQELSTREGYQYDYIHTFLENTQKAIGDDDIKCIADACLSLLSIGSSGPAVVSAQLIIYLLSHPSCLEQVKLEIRKVNIQAAQFENITKDFPYVDACIKEVLRLISHPLGSMRKVKKPFQFEGSGGQTYRVHVGEYVGTTHIVSCLDPSIFPQPNDFNPSRWVDDPSLEARLRYEFTPFSGGSHACPGKRISFILIKLFLISLFSDNKKIKIKGRLPPLTFRKQQLATRSGATYIRFESGVEE